MIHGSCMIAVSRLRGKSWYFSPAAIAEVARDLPTFSEKVLPHIFSNLVVGREVVTMVRGTDLGLVRVVQVKCWREVLRL